jgi:hypothetical protein
MAAAIYLVSKSQAESPEQTLFDGIHAMIVNADDGGTTATTIAEAIATATANGYSLPAGYFDTAELLGPDTGGIMNTDEDALIFLRREIIRVIA